MAMSARELLKQLHQVKAGIEKGEHLMARIINLPENNKIILEDEEKFQDRLKTRLLIVDEVDNGTTL